MSSSTPSPYGLAYKAPERITEEEKELVRNAFKDERVLDILKKIFMPSYADESNPFEFSGADAFLMGRDWSTIPVDEAKALIVARQDTINWLAGGLTLIKNWLHERPETAQQIAERERKNSTK